ncbi:cell division protein FtsY [Bordetella sp. H567]|uniref:signal recognition particle-docking protein FtsY n=1 Tax=Bordetella sp. H567 TaxID=1697043 RepID=UPI00081C6DC1|nr:signal recognition particle-docking protein FtsY [Bordetella sp. H567]AOB33342.1 cell division protein FtsY [Bordetella sp. H567]
MLNFFKKKTPAPVPEPAQAPTPAEPAGRDAPIPAPAAPAPEAPPRPDQQSPWPSARVEPPVDLGGASGRPPGQAAAQAPAAAPLMPATATATAADAPALSSPPETSAAVEPAAKKSWLQRLKQGLSRTGQSIGGLFVGVKVDENLFEELETALIMADAGVEATEALLTALRARVKKERIEDAAQVRDVLRQILADQLRPLERGFDLHRAQPLVVMIAGVNGAGKTTSIGKLANTFQRQGASVLLAAGDTFRAAARQQLMEWGARNSVTVIAQEGGDPAAVAFDAVNAGRARGAGVVMVDTAGRLPTQLHLMEELRKIRRVIGKADAAAPHEVLLVVDGNTGQNALAQIRAFDAAINLTGLVVTKLDGTAKGGTLAAVAAGSQGVRPIPVYWIGVGEGLEDLQPFVADEFAAALLGMSA